MLRVYTFKNILEFLKILEVSRMSWNIPEYDKSLEDAKIFQNVQEDYSCVGCSNGMSLKYFRMLKNIVNTYIKGGRPHLSIVVSN